MNDSNIYAVYRYPAQIISHAVWLYHRFTLSFRDIEGVVNHLFRFGRHLVQAKHYRAIRERSFSEWKQVGCAKN